MLLLTLVLVAGAVLFLYLNQRNFQRVDYGHLIDDEERERRLNARLRHLEDLLSELARYEQLRREDLDSLLSAAQQRLAEEIAGAKQHIVTDVLSRPAEMDFLLMRAAQAEPPAQLSQALLSPATEEQSVNMLRFLKSPRQRQIAELLEQGYRQAEVCRMLGVSGCEVDLVSSIIFGAKSA